MSTFQGCSNFTIRDGRITTIGRDQYNINVHGTLVQYLGPGREEEREWTIWDDYKNIPTWKIRLKRSLGETPVKRDWEVGRRYLDACREINVVSVRGEDKDSEFLYIVYTGPDAVEVFLRDFEEFSHVKNLNCIELFGYNRGAALPALVFYDAFVPFARIFEKNQLSPLLHIYILYQNITNSFPGGTEFGELWVDPRTGRFRRGPYVRYSSNVRYLVSDFGTTEDSVDEEHFLSIQAFSDPSTVFNYLARALSTSDILRGIRRSHRILCESISNEDTVSVLSSLPGRIYNRHRREIIARWPGDRNGWSYKFWSQRGMPDARGESAADLDNFSVRFTVSPSDIQHLQDQWLELHYTVYRKGNEFANAWVTQGHAVFSQLEIHRDEWDKYYSCWLHLQPGERQAQRKGDIPADRPVYLFILRIPQPVDQRNAWGSWMKGKKYFWSFDPYGCEVMTEDEWVKWGLPSYTCDIEVGHAWWDPSAYDAVRQLQVFNGFVPTTRDFSRSLGCQGLAVVGDEARFEEVKVGAFTEGKGLYVSQTRHRIVISSKGTKREKKERPYDESTKRAEAPNITATTRREDNKEESPAACKPDSTQSTFIKVEVANDNDLVTMRCNKDKHTVSAPSVKNIKKNSERETQSVEKRKGLGLS
uniref:Uncharacterized protein n=1 Tax=Moniliophthora roreri TaxID=221103 RepID=A0A0W0F632_MONRR